MQTKYPVLAKAKTRRINRLWHVGTFNPADKRDDSHEGNGLSVSRHPEEWAAIAKLGGGNLYELTKTGGVFLDFHALSKTARTQLQQWGLANGWLQMEARWRAQWFDDELEYTCYALFATLEQAEAEVEDREQVDDEEPVQEVQVPCPTEKMAQRVGFKVPDLHALDIVATFWAEDEVALDGVWWNDKLDPANYSAPRGVICLRQLPSWDKRLVQGPQTRKRGSA